MTQLALHVIEELLRLDDEGRLSKVCTTYSNGRIATEYRAEPKVQVGGPCVLVTYGYNASNQLITTERTIATWTAGCEAAITGATGPSTGGSPPSGVLASSHDHQELIVDDTSWTAIPNFANRITLVIQNNSNRDLLINSDNAAPLTEGTLIAQGDERQYENFGPQVTLYLVCIGGVRTIDIEQTGVA